jgi:hypothetical protein
MTRHHGRCKAASVSLRRVGRRLLDRANLVSGPCKPRTRCCSGHPRPSDQLISHNCDAALIARRRGRSPLSWTEGTSATLRRSLQGELVVGWRSQGKFGKPAARRRSCQATQQA